MTQQTYRFSYTVTAYGRSRKAIKSVSAYCWNDAAQRVAAHVAKKWADAPAIEIENAMVGDRFINPDLLPEINAIVCAIAKAEGR